MALPNARNQYLKTQIETASKEQLVVMLFDGIIRFTEQARKAINDKQLEDSHHALMRAQAIIMELICTVDKEKGGEVANNLLSLHAYAFNCLIVCNMKKDVTQIDEVQKVYRELREGWTSAMDSLGVTATNGKTIDTTPSGPAAGQPLSGGKPAGQNAPANPVNPTKPAAPTNGFMASTPAAPVAAKPAAPVMTGGYGMGKTAPAIPAAAAPKATGYGMGASAMFAKPAGSIGQQQAAAAKQSPMMTAYTNGTRSIA